MLAAGHMDGNITIPGHTVGAAECPSDLLEQEPELPKLYIMVSRKDLYPEVPGTVMRQWATHGVFGEEFNKFLNQLHEEYGPLPEQKDSPTETKTGAGPTGEGDGKSGTTEVPQGKKRKPSTPPSTAKRTKVDRAKVIPTSAPCLSMVHVFILCNCAPFPVLMMS